MRILYLSTDPRSEDSYCLLGSCSAKSCFLVKVDFFILFTSIPGKFRIEDRGVWPLSLYPRQGIRKLKILVKKGCFFAVVFKAVRLALFLSKTIKDYVGAFQPVIMRLLAVFRPVK